MGGITYLDLKCNIEDIQQIGDLSITQKVNEHAMLHLTGTILEDKKDKIVTRDLEGKEIEVFTKNNPKITLFKGLVQKAEVHFIGNLYSLKIEGVSYSILTDIRKKSRSFQNIGMTYTDLLKQVMNEYDKGDVIDLASQGKTIDTLRVQYEETDWEYLKRLASHFNMGILPNVTLGGPKITFGTYEGKDWGKVNCNEYTVSKDILTFKKASENTYPSLLEDDVTEYEIKLPDSYDIGDKVNYQGKTFFIKSKNSVLRQGMVQFSYHLSTKNGLGNEKTYAEQLTGVSLKGTVLESVQDKVKVKLEIDEKQDVETAFLFPYTTTYTAEGNSGWYVMPEQGDTVFIYFPSREEGMAVAINSYRTGEKGTDSIDDPAIKYFRTADGKELKFTPEEIVITCIQGSDPQTGENKNVFIKLNQNSGIEITSSLPIQITSGEDVSINAEDKIEILASKSVKLKCKKSQIKMDSKVDICGPEVRIN